MSVLNGVVAPVVRVEFDATIPLGVKEPEESDWTALPVDVLRGVSIRRGKTQENQAVQAGEATITLDNRSGDFDPMNSASPYWVESIFGGLSYFSPRLGMRVVATWDEVDYVLYTGYLEQLVMDYGLNPTVTITCTDALAYLAQQQLVAVADGLSPVGNGDQVWFRVDSLLDPTDVGTRREGCSFPAGLRGIDTSVDNTMYGTRYGSDVLSLLQTAADCGPARLFVDADGLLRLLRWDGGDSPGVLLSDDLSNPDAIGYDSIDVDPGSRYLLNTVWVYKVDGNGTDRGRVLGLASDSRTRFGTFANQYTLPTNNAAPVANFLANQYAEPFDRVRRISFSMMNLGSRFPTVLVMDLADYVSVERTTYDGRSLYFDCNVEGIEYDITPDGFRAAYLCSTLLVRPIPPESEYWLAELGATTSGWSTAVDTGGNIYGAGLSRDPAISSDYAVQVVKVSYDGVIEWQNAVNLGTSTYWRTKAVLDADKNFYVVAIKDFDSYVFKFDPLGVLVWQRKLSDFSLSCVTVDSSGAIYVGGRSNISARGFLAKVDSSGNLVWQKELVTDWATFEGLAVSGSLLLASANVSGETGIDATNKPTWFKFNLDGDLLAAKSFEEHRDSSDTSLVANAAGNSWMVFFTSFAEPYVVKMNSAGSVLWSKRLEPYKIWKVSGVDSDENAFLENADVSAISLGSNLLKLESDGEVSWQRNLNFLGGFTYTTPIANSSNELCLVGHVDGSGSHLLVGRLPGNGSHTGRYSLGGQDVDYLPTSFLVTNTTTSPTSVTYSLVSGSATISTTTFADNFYEFPYINTYL